jgi:hypothetical protein
MMARAPTPGTNDTARMISGLTNLFLVHTRDFGDIGTDLATWWKERYSDTLEAPEGRKAAVDWFAAVLSLLAGCFTKEMDFPDADWEEIREAVSAEADNMDIEILTSILTVIVDRGKA